jgi:hypothetical protein
MIFAFYIVAAVIMAIGSLYERRFRDAVVMPALLPKADSKRRDGHVC